MPQGMFFFALSVSRAIFVAELIGHFMVIDHHWL